MRHRYICISSVIILILLSACQNQNEKSTEIGDGGVLSGEPCSAPCLWHIIPGVTTEKQARDIISSKLNLNECDYWDTRKSGGTRGMNCPNLEITFNDIDIVNMVSYQPSTAISVNEIIKKYGIPDGVSIEILGIEMTPPLSMRLYFDQEWMIISLPEQNSDTYNLQTDISVRSIGYYEKSDYMISKNSTQKWNGFVKYSYNDQ